MAGPAHTTSPIHRAFEIFLSDHGLEINTAGVLRDASLHIDVRREAGRCLLDRLKGLVKENRPTRRAELLDAQKQILTICVESLPMDIRRPKFEKLLKKVEAGQPVVFASSESTVEFFNKIVDLILSKSREAA